MNNDRRADPEGVTARVVTVASGALLIVSEALPFFDTNVNGILHTLHILTQTTNNLADKELKDAE